MRRRRLRARSIAWTAHFHTCQSARKGDRGRATPPRVTHPATLQMSCWNLRANIGLPSLEALLGKVRETHSVGSICDHDFSVFTVTNIATENTDAVPPAHAVPRMPKPANQRLQRCRGPRAPLTCLAPLTAWQSLCTGHFDASLWPSLTGTA
jgi:hypothetical protein